MAFQNTRRTVLALALFVCGCRSGSSSTSEPTAPAEQTYEVRGVIEAVNVERSRVEIAHEAIADFVDASGKKVGMASMTMPFTVGPGVELAALAQGDKVAFTLEVRWESKPDLYIPQITELPADTALDVE